MRTYSFDIFDTCLVRTCGRSAYVFDILAERVLGKDATETMIMDFSHIRRSSEELARNKYVTDDVEDINIDQIYQECDFTPLTKMSNYDIMKMELELEKEILVPVYSIKNEIDDIHKKGESVIFISDMYLPKSVILEILVNFGLYIDGDKLYVSSDIKKTKATGNLFKFVKERENIDFKEWFHKGDNKNSDYIIPKHLGITANLVNHNYSLYEKKLASWESGGGKQNRHLLSSISKALRYSYNPSPELFVACDFVAPIYVPFVYYIMEHASNKGIKDMFFLARDGYIFYKIAETFQKVFPLIRIHYLYVSRKALYLPSLEDVSYDELSSRLAFINNNCSLEDVCERFQIYEEIGLFYEYSVFTGEKLLHSLLNNKHFIECIIKKRNIQRDLCLRYFEQEGLTRGKAAIIDLSGSRRCHFYINKILTSSNYEPVFGYYFDVTDEHLVGCDYLSLFQVSRGRFNSTVTKNPQNVFEQYFSMSFHESTDSYKESNGKIIPRFCKSHEINEKTKVVLDNNVLVCQQFAYYYLLLIDYDKSKEYVGECLSVFNFFSRVPMYYYVKAFTGITISGSSINSRCIIDESGFIACLRKRHKLYWQIPALVYNCRWPKIATSILRILYVWEREKKLS